VHADLEPEVSRAPDAWVVRDAFTEVLTASSQGSAAVVLVAVVGMQVVGMAELAPSSPSPPARSWFRSPRRRFMSWSHRTAVAQASVSG